MRILSVIIISMTLLLSTGCGRGDKINARSFKTSLKSVNMIKNRLNQEQRIAFELSFWELRNTYRKNSEFLDLIDGKNSDELIALGKETFEQKKAEGFPEYQKFASWDEMISHFAQERMDQNKKRKRDPRDEDNSVLYKL